MHRRPNRSRNQIQKLFEQHNWAEVVRLGRAGYPRSADMNFEYGLALAHLQRWTEARSALLHGARHVLGRGDSNRVGRDCL